MRDHALAGEHCSEASAIWSNDLLCQILSFATAALTEQLHLQGLILANLLALIVVPAKFAFMDYPFTVIHHPDSTGAFDESSNYLMPAEAQGQTANWFEQVDTTLATHLDAPCAEKQHCASTALNIFAAEANLKLTLMEQGYSREAPVAISSRSGDQQTRAGIYEKNLFAVEQFNPTIHIREWQPYLATNAMFQTKQFADQVWHQCQVATAEPPMTTVDLFFRGEAVSWWLHSSWKFFIAFVRARPGLDCQGTPDIEMYKIAGRGHSYSDEEGQQRFWYKPERAERFNMPRDFCRTPDGNMPGHFLLPTNSQSWQVTTVFRLQDAWTRPVLIMHCMQPPLPGRRAGMEMTLIKCSDVPQQIVASLSARSGSPFATGGLECPGFQSSLLHSG